MRVRTPKVIISTFHGKAPFETLLGIEKLTSDYLIKPISVHKIQTKTSLCTESLI